MVNSEKKYAGRVVALASVFLGLIGAILPAVAQMDLSSTAGIVAGLIAVTSIAVKFLDGWQRYEERLDGVASPAAAPQPRAVEEAA